MPSGSRQLFLGLGAVDLVGLLGLFLASSLPLTCLGAHGCEPGQCQGADELEDVGLLQRTVRESTLQADGRAGGKASRHLAMTFEGGGFKAHASYTGLIAGLQSLRPTEGSGGVGGLFDETKTLSSVSGGSWFISELIYSSSFQGLVESIAAKPDKAESLYYTQWIMPFLGSLVQSGQPTPSPSEPKHVQCPGTGNWCAGNQCCPGAEISLNKTFPCPSADPHWNLCEGPAPAPPPTPIKCPLSDTWCSGNQCCPRIEASNNKTFPCPSADDDFKSNGCETNGLVKGGQGWYPGELLEVLAELSFAMGANTTWEIFVHRMLESTGGIGDDVQLMSEVNPWAKGKTWLAGVTVATPGGGGVGTCQGRWGCLGSWIGDTYAYIFGKTNDMSTKYTTKPSPSKLPLHTPAKFSVVLGEDLDAAAPHPFCTGTCNEMGFDYQYNSPLSENVSTMPLASTPGYKEYNGRLPVNSVVAASSSFLGFTVFLGLFDASTTDMFTSSLEWLLSFFVGKDVQDEIGDKIKNLLLTDWALWSDPGASEVAKSGGAFHKGRMIHSILEEEPQKGASLVNMMAEGAFHAVYDGGMTDNTGIGHAVAAGATEVVAVMDSDDLWTLFANFDRTGNILPDFGGIFPVTCPFCYAFFPIFQEDYRTVQGAFYKNSHELTLDPVESGDDDQPTPVLSNIRVGTINATTSPSEEFGVKGGLPVRLHVIFLNSTASIGGYDYKSYATLVQEISDVLRAERNQDAAAKILSCLTSPDPCAI